MDHRNGDELEAPLLESAPLPEKRRSTFLTVCPFILGRGQILWQLSLLLHITAEAGTSIVCESTGIFRNDMPLSSGVSLLRTWHVLTKCCPGASASEKSHARMAMQAMSSVRDWPSMGESLNLTPSTFFVLVTASYHSIKHARYPTRGRQVLLC